MRNFDSVSLPEQKLKPINHFPQVNPLFNYLRALCFASHYSFFCLRALCLPFIAIIITCAHSDLPFIDPFITCEHSDLPFIVLLITHAQEAAWSSGLSA